MKNRLFYVGAMIMAVCACSKEANQDINVKISTEALKVSVTGTDTKSSLGEDGKSVLWTEGDAVSVLSNVAGVQAVEMQLSGIDGASATISGEVAEGTSELMMVYPTTAASSYSFDAANPSVTVSLPSAQTAVEGTFDNNSNIAVAFAKKTPGVPEVENVVFHNVCGLIKFTIPTDLAEAVTEVTFKNNGTSPLAGTYTVNPSTMGGAAGTGSTSLTMTGTFEAGKTYCFISLPAKVEGFTLTLKTEHHNYSVTNESAFEIASGSNKKLPVLTFKAAPDVWAQHYVSGGKLIGTRLKLDNANLSDNGQDVYVEVKNAAGDLYRSLSCESKESVTLEVPENLPYLPHGEYTANFTYKIGAHSTSEVSAIFNVPQPTGLGLALTLNEPVTSYSKYLAGEIDEANLWTNDKVGNLGATVNISDAVLKQMEVACEFLVDGVSKRSTLAVSDGAYAASTIEKLPMAEHKLTAKINFDGVEINSSEKAFVITGLPHVFAMTEEFKLASVNATFVNGHIELGYHFPGTAFNACLATSTVGFYVPQNIDVKTYTNVNIYAKKRGSGIFTTYVNTDFTQKIASVEVRKQGSNDTVEATYNFEDNGVFTSSANTIEFESSHRTSAGPHCDVYSCKIEYR